MKVKEYFGLLSVAGVDEHTPLVRLQKLMEHPQIEVGFLLNRVSGGIVTHCPDVDWIARVAKELRGNKVLHICGQDAAWETLIGNLDDVVKPFQRVQINGVLNNVRGIEKLAGRWSDKTVITTHTRGAEFLVDGVNAHNHAVLVNDSAGRGLTPKRWQAPQTPKRTGFAGGIGRDNIQAEMLRILCEAQPKKNSWLAIESGAQSGGGQFSMDATEAMYQDFCEMGEREMEI